MSFVPNNYQQISLFDALGFLSPRKQRILDKSWAKPFSDYIFSNINSIYNIVLNIRFINIIVIHDLRFDTEHILGK